MKRRTLLAAALPLAVLPTTPAAVPSVLLEAPKPARLRTFYVPQPPCRVEWRVSPACDWHTPVPVPGLYHPDQIACWMETPDA